MIDFFCGCIPVSKIITACFVLSGTGDSVFQNRHSHGLALHLSGKKQYCFSGGKCLSVSAGDIIYLPKHSDYKVFSSENGDCYCINFDIPEDIGGEPFVFRVKNINGYIDRFKRAVPVWERKSAGYEAFVTAQLLNVIYLMQCEHYASYTQSGQIKKILPAVDYIKEHFLDEIISIEHLAALCSMTSVYFRSIFKSHFGLSPIAYINSLKISRAKELLESGLYTVSQAAEMSGYTDVCHFSREFKKAVGVPPSEYKKG